MREWHSLLSTLRMRGPPPPTPLAYRPSRLAQIVSARAYYLEKVSIRPVAALQPSARLPLTPRATRALP